MGKDFYAALELEKNASDNDIRSAYKRLARKYHPDLNPDAGEKFKEIQEAYEVLRDAEKREIYDQYGEEGLNDPMGGMGGMGGFPFPGMFHPHHHHHRQASRQQKGETVKQGLTVSLEEFYNGATRKIRVTRTRICKTCNGVGASKKEAVVTCKRCHGQGVTTEVVQVAPGFITQMRKPCSACEGQGKSVDDKFICKSCTGKKVQTETKTLEVHIDVGMKNGQKIVFENEADEKPGVQAGDIVFILQEKKHSQFEREGQNLIYEKQINLTEALTGVEFVIEHLDKRKLLVKSKPGDVIRPGQIMMIPNEGMPQYKNPFNRGSLLIKFDVVFPTTISDDIATKLISMLPAKSKMDIDNADEGHEVFLEDAVFTESSSNGRREAYDSDDEQEGRNGGGGVSCASQ